MKLTYHLQDRLYQLAGLYVLLWLMRLANAMFYNEVLQLDMWYLLGFSMVHVIAGGIYDWLYENRNK